MVTVRRMRRQSSRATRASTRSGTESSPDRRSRGRSTVGGHLVVPLVAPFRLRAAATALGAAGSRPRCVAQTSTRPHWAIAVVQYEGTHMPRLSQKDLTDDLAAVRAVIAASSTMEENDPQVLRHLEGAAAAIEELIRQSRSRPDS